MFIFSLNLDLNEQSDGLIQLQNITDFFNSHYSVSTREYLFGDNEFFDLNSDISVDSWKKTKIQDSDGTRIIYTLVDIWPKKNELKNIRDLKIDLFKKMVETGQFDYILVYSCNDDIGDTYYFGNLISIFCKLSKIELKFKLNYFKKKGALEYLNIVKRHFSEKPKVDLVKVELKNKKEFLAKTLAENTVESNNSSVIKGKNYLGKVFMR